MCVAKEVKVLCYAPPKNPTIGSESESEVGSEGGGGPCVEVDNQWIGAIIRSNKVSRRSFKNERVQ